MGYKPPEIENTGFKRSVLPLSVATAERAIHFYGDGLTTIDQIIYPLMESDPGLSDALIAVPAVRVDLEGQSRYTYLEGLKVFVVGLSELVNPWVPLHISTSDVFLKELLGVGDGDESFSTFLQNLEEKKSAHSFDPVFDFSGALGNFLRQSRQLRLNMNLTTRRRMAIFSSEEADFAAEAERVIGPIAGEEGLYNFLLGAMDGHHIYSTHERLAIQGA